MGKKSIQFDPQFKINGSKEAINARQIEGCKRGKYGKLNIQRWNQQQQQRYINFIKNNLQKMECPKLWKTYTLMASVIRTRNSQQCKTHHAKMLKKFNKSIDLLLESSNRKQIIFQENLEVKTQKMEETRQNQTALNQILTPEIQEYETQQIFQESLFFQQEEIFNVLSL